MIIALLPMLPEIARAANIDEIPAVAATLVIAVTITRVLSLPAVESFLEQYAPWLALNPPPKGVEDYEDDSDE